MNLSIMVAIDGEQLILNEELNATLSAIVNSYVKQKISGVLPKEKKVRVPRDPNAPKREPRVHMSEEERTNVFNRGSQLQDKTKMGASAIIAEEMNRAKGTIYTHLLNFEKLGRLKFKEYDYKAGMIANINAFKQAKQLQQPQPPQNVLPTSIVQ